ncbi:MAG: hypothetical protein IJG37_04385 [Synergistaceae bacterium]|nr:hypothetical protein [Synergistaceae bacterium]MBQ4430120.1 hypothetical protein [Synergistaceae bacterium]
MSKFTQGKWTAEMIYGDHPIVTADGRMVADCFNNEANARLIASAPEMYELLKVWTQIQAQPTLRNAQETARELLARIDGKEEK